MFPMGLTEDKLQYEIRLRQEQYRQSNNLEKEIVYDRLDSLELMRVVGLPHGTTTFALAANHLT